MKRYIVLILLFFAFNANAIEGSMMMSTMTFGMDESTTLQPKQGMHSHHNIDVSKMSDQDDASEKTSSHCDENIFCGLCSLHSSSMIFQIEAPNISFLGPLSFNTEHICSKVSNDHTYLLRPPRLFQDSNDHTYLLRPPRLFQDS